MITTITLKRYLLKKGITNDISKCAVEEFSSSGINSVYRVRTEHGTFMIKQFLNRGTTDVIARKHFFSEKAAIAYLNNILDHRVAPPIVFYDENELVMCMPDFGVANRLDKVAQGKMLNKMLFYKLGKLLADIQNLSFQNKALPILFDNEAAQQRKWKYYYAVSDDTVLNKERDALFQTTERNRVTFIHNDLSLRNIFVVGREKIFLLDYEDAHYGDPAQEMGHLLAELFLYCLAGVVELSVVLSCWKAYRKRLKFPAKGVLERNGVKHIGFMMLGLLRREQEAFSFIPKEKQKMICEKAREMIVSPKIKTVKKALKMKW